jgi:type VI secretion system protein ImpL
MQKTDIADMNETPTQPAGLFIGIAAAIVFLGLGIAVWMEGPQHGWSGDKRIIIELGLFCAVLLVFLLVKYFEATLRLIASLRAARWLVRYDAGKRTQAQGGTDFEVLVNRSTALKQRLTDHHDRHWRSRTRWLLVTGDEALIKRLAPELPE